MSYPTYDSGWDYTPPDENDDDDIELGRLLDAEDDQRIDEMRGK